ncbi:hypothetical protein [Mesorhizobium sp. M6A.T.Ce.TU.002.03.1.1]|nr:hypothetical protein [Mesorhizobium sp. M6A.T.Ce.TU.002.03.1.1]
MDVHATTAMSSRLATSILESDEDASVYADYDLPESQIGSGCVDT